MLVMLKRKVSSMGKISVSMKIQSWFGASAIAVAVLASPPKALSQG